MDRPAHRMTRIDVMKALLHEQREPHVDRVRRVGGRDGRDPDRRALVRKATAIVVHVRGESFTAERANPARVALSDSVIATAALNYERAAAEAARTIADRGGAVAREAGLQTSVLVCAALTPWRGVWAAAEEFEVDLIVCGSRAQGGFSRAVLGSTSSSLVHHARRPVLVVPPASVTVDGPTVIGYDGSERARHAIAVTAQLLDERPAVVVHAWSSPVQHSLVGGSLLAAPLAEIQEIARHLDEMFAGQAQDIAGEGATLAHDQGLNARPMTVEAAPGTWRALTSAAHTERAALIVAGNRGRGAPRGHRRRVSPRS
jgi:nucleotide-binding universal stress UspA family protein